MHNGAERAFGLYENELYRFLCQCALALLGFRHEDSTEWVEGLTVLDAAWTRLEVWTEFGAWDLPSLQISIFKFQILSGFLQKFWTNCS